MTTMRALSTMDMGPAGNINILRRLVVLGVLALIGCNHHVRATSYIIEKLMHTLRSSQHCGYSVFPDR